MSVQMRKPPARRPVALTMPPVVSTVSSLYVFSAKYPKCAFCGCALRGELTTGVLPGIRNVWKCEECQTLYNEAREMKANVQANG